MKKYLSFLILISVFLVNSIPFAFAQETESNKITVEKSLWSGELIIANANVKDFGAVGDGKKDDTEAINDAIRKVGNMGGGVVFIPSGKYRIDGNITVNDSVTLRGQWQNPDIGGMGEGTTLLIYGGKGDVNADPAVLLRLDACIMDINFYYPEQSTDNIIPYPFTIDSQTHSVTARNITLYNSYKGIELNGSAEHCYNIYGTALHTGTSFDKDYDVSEFTYFTFNSKYWLNCPLNRDYNVTPDKEKLVSFLKKTFVPIRIGKCDDAYVYGLNVPKDECLVGIDIKASESVLYGPKIAYGLFTQINGLSVARDTPMVPTALITDDIIGSLKYTYKLADERYPTKTEIFNITDSKYGAIGNATDDDTNAIKKAIDDANANGGGIVYFPPGRYVVKEAITVPSNVELRGAWEAAHTAMTKRVSEIHAYIGRNDENGAPFITLSKNSGLHGLTIYYPEQKGDDIVPYSWTVTGKGSDVWVEYVNLTNSYKGINMYDNKCDNFVIKNMWICGLKNGFAVGGGTVKGKIEFNTIHYGVWSELEKNTNMQNQKAYTIKNLTAFTFGNCKNIEGFSNFSFQANRSFAFEVQNGGYCEDSTFFRVGCDNPEGQVCVDFVEAKNLVIVGLSSGSSNYLTKMADTFSGNVTVYGQNIWGGTLNSIDKDKIKIYAVGQNENLCFSKTVTINGDNYGEDPQILVDGSRFNGYKKEDVTMPWNMVVDLGKDEKISSYKLICAGATGLGQDMNIPDFEIYISSNNKTWQMIDSVKDNNLEIINKDLAKTYNARFIKLVVLKPAQVGNTLYIQDFQAFSVKLSQPARNNISSDIIIYVVAFIVIAIFAILIIIAALIYKKKKK